MPNSGSNSDGSRLKGPGSHFPDRMCHIIYHRVIRTEFIALWPCSKKSHESRMQSMGCYKPLWSLLQTTGAGCDNPYPEPSLSLCNPPPLQGDYS